MSNKKATVVMSYTLLAFSSNVFAHSQVIPHTHLEAGSVHLSFPLLSIVALGLVSFTVLRLLKKLK